MFIINKCVHQYNKILLSNKNEQTVDATWMNLKINMLSEISQTKRVYTAYSIYIKL